jgi:hypothetical protein
VSHSSTEISDGGYLASELACYLQTAAIEVTLAGMQAVENKYDARYSARQYHYQLPSGKLQLLALTLYLPLNTSSADIETVRMAAIKAALAWHKASLSQNKNIGITDTRSEDIETVSHDVLVFDIQLTDAAVENDKTNTDSQYSKSTDHLQHAFGARYFLEDLVVDMSESGQQLQVFSWHDWHSILLAVQTPCELWRFLSYHLKQLQYSAISHAPSFASEEALITQFLQSPSLFTPAIAVDNALIKNETQDEPNPALVAMALAYKNQSATAQMYQQHMQQAATLWSQLSKQMIATYSEKQIASNDSKPSEVPLSRWQQQLLDESLFSRHELIRTLYRHPKQNETLRQNGYVVHQHSYESLGRHYVLIFYGQDPQAHNSKAAIQPNLAKIAQDVATRLPIVELHHIIVLGIDFITEADETFMDIDVWIQPVDTMTQRERQLTKQIQALKKQESQQSAQNTDKQAAQNPENNNQPDKLPQVHLSLSIHTCAKR